ncbi:MAG: hypothetical protein R2719_05855 [Micropruina sp.]
MGASTSHTGAEKYMSNNAARPDSEDPAAINDLLEDNAEQQRNAGRNALCGPGWSS